MKIIAKRKNYIKAPAEKITSVDNVDRTGYIPMDLQYERLMSAGASLERVYTDQYMFQYQDVADSIANDSIHNLLRGVSMRGNKYTPQQLHQMYVDKYGKMKKAEQKIEELRDNYRRWLEEKDTINSNLNEFKKIQEERVENV